MAIKTLKFNNWYYYNNTIKYKLYILILLKNQIFYIVFLAQIIQTLRQILFKE